MATINTRTIFEDATAHIKVNNTLLTKIHHYDVAFVNKNDDHIMGFGSNLLGVYPIRFTPDDKNKWLIDLLDLDASEIRAKIVTIPGVKEEWVRGTDVMNLSCLYLLHLVYNDSGLGIKARQQGMIDILLALHYKLFGSLLAYFFKYPVDEGLALATYAALSKKFAIKQNETWGGVLEARCQDIISHDSIHLETIKSFNDDAAIQYMITDIQGRLRRMVVNIWEVMAEIRDKDNRFTTNKATIELEGKTTVRDLERNQSTYLNYLDQVILEKNRFVKPELAHIVSNLVETMPEKLLYDVLFHVVERSIKHDTKIKDLVHEVMYHAFTTLAEDRDLRESMTDIGIVGARFRSLYMSSKSTTPSLIKMREMGVVVVGNSISSKNPTVISSVRTGFLLYVLLRTLTMKHYG